MKTINNYIIEKFKISKDIKTNKYLSKDEWFSYISKIDGKVIEINKKFYTISLKNYKGNNSPELTIYVEHTSPTPKFWRACMPQELRTYYSKDIYIIYSPDGDDKEYYIDKDSLDKSESERGWAFTTYNAEIILNKLKEIVHENN